LHIVYPNSLAGGFLDFFYNKNSITSGYAMLIRSPHSDDIHVRVLDTNKNNKAGQPPSLGSVLMDGWFISANVL
jgi:hypothetical protein